MRLYSLYGVDVDLLTLSYESWSDWTSKTIFVD